MSWLVEEAIQGRNANNYWWVAPVYPQARMAFRRLKRGLPRYIYSSNESELTVTLPNGAIIAFRSGEKPDNLYGEDVYAAVVDEATRVREESWHAIRSTLTATRGPIRIIGNVKGRRNWAYRLSRLAESGAKDWHYAKLTAYDAVDAGVLDLEEVEEARRQLPDNVFKELYLAEPSDDGGNPFGQTAIESCIGDMSTEPPVVYGIDLAKSVDYTVAIGLDKRGRVCSFDRFQNSWEETFYRLQKLIGYTPAIVDSTGVGDPLVERLQKSLPNVEGYTFTSPSKQKLMEGLAVVIQSNQIVYPDNEIAKELFTFGYEYSRTGVKYTAPDGLHDDCVMALALAVHGQNNTAGDGVW